MSRKRGGKRTVVEEVNSEARPSYRLRWTRRAEVDLEAIDAYIAADDPAAAAR